MNAVVHFTHAKERFLMHKPVFRHNYRGNFIYLSQKMEILRRKYHLEFLLNEIILHQSSRSLKYADYQHWHFQIRNQSCYYTVRDMLENFLLSDFTFIYECRWKHFNLIVSDGTVMLLEEY